MLTLDPLTVNPAAEFRDRIPRSTQVGESQKVLRRTRKYEVRGKKLRDATKQKRTYCAPPYPGKAIL